MAIRGKRNPFPKVKPATNSGIFQSPQKKDPVSTPKEVQRAVDEAYKNTNYKAGDY